MDIPQIKKAPVEYDVAIVGSGAGGGMAAYMLAKAGAKVILLEAGGYFDPADPKYITQLKWPYESPRRGANTTRAFGDFDAAWGGWDIEGEPYSAKPGTEFHWFRSRMLGGRTNHWGRISLRFGPDDFRRRSLTGVGDDWPFGYEELKPFYDRCDKMLGLFGTNLPDFPNEPDGYFLPPPKPRLHELLLMKAGKNIGVPIVPSRMSMLTKPINNERGSCFYCGQCGRACQAYADFSASSVLCIPAVKTGNVTLVNGAMCREVLTDQAGLATGVSYVHTGTMQEHTVRAKAVMVAASAGESARLLLNSKSPRYPNGLANGSGVIGKYINDSTGASRSAFIPALMDRVRYNEDGVGGMHVFTPWWLDNKKLDFPRGYHIEFGGGMGMPGYGFGMGIENTQSKEPNRKRPIGGYGASLKDDYRRYYGAYIGMSGRGEPVPREDNYCEIDPNKVDKYGIPTLRFHYKWSDYEVKQAKHMQDTFEEIIHAMGGIPTGPKPGPDTDHGYGLAAPGRIIHEVGTVRMGNDPKTSALNKYQQSHECKNLFVVDAAPFVSQGDKNVTWTILASSMRTSEYLIDQVKKKNI